MHTLENRHYRLLISNLICRVSIATKTPGTVGSVGWLSPAWLLNFRRSFSNRAFDSSGDVSRVGNNILGS